MARQKQDIAKLRIHPGIGIARLGNSPDGYFIGPEAPGHPANPPGGFKDAEGRIKRQAARFRVFGLDAKGKVVAEVDDGDAEITWRVHLANKKGAWFRFTSDPAKRETDLRNSHVQPGLPPEARDALIIDPGPRSLRGRAQVSAPFDGGAFLGHKVSLGELRTDEMGRLLVLGGFGRSGPVGAAHPIASSYNNDGWFDDAADGPVEAEVTLSDGRKLTAEPAWVIVAPPNFAPAITNLVTLYERLHETLGLNRLSDKKTVSYEADIHPLLARLMLYSWVNKDALRGHGPGKTGDLLAPENQALLTGGAPASEVFRQNILKRLRVPYSLADEKTQVAQANYFYMPQLAGDHGDPIQGKPGTWMTLLKSQYEALKRWAAGDFEIGAPASFPPFDEIPIAERPAALDRAALEPCVGAPFCPGIEMTYIAEEPSTFTVESGRAIRIGEGFGPGDITRYMALPWQADFHDCFDHWWPAQRPDDVLPEAALQRLEVSWQGRSPPPPAPGSEFVPASLAGQETAAALVYRVPWARGMALSTEQGGEEMVRYWSDLGFVVPKKTRQGEEIFVETERAPVVGLDQRTLFYHLMNIDDHPESLPRARAFVDHYLAASRALQKDPAAPYIWWSFDYTPEALDARLLEIYNDLADNAAVYDPADDLICRSREDVIEWLWQWGPFNMTDGAWLRNVNHAGPLDEVHALLFSILCDEMGNGQVSRSHANLARDLLHSVGRYPEVVASSAYAMDPTLLDSAFTVPAFALAISQFTERYLPEIIGMTLYLEWCVLDLKPSVELLRYYDIDPHFYVLHVGIDNAADGHGHLAREAARLYLDQVRLAGGEPAVQAHWQRIWDGFVAYGTSGSFGQDLKTRLQGPLAPEQRAIDMIRHKAPFGRLNHGNKMIGANRINDWFRDPPGFLKALVEADYVIPGDPENSPLFKLFTFQSGPMYKVFTEVEIGIWRDWILSLVPARAAPPTAVAEAMVKLIEGLRLRQSGVEAHKEMALRVPGKKKKKRTIQEWFGRPVREFMAALADPANGWIVPGEPGASRFVTELLSDANAMGRAFDDVVAGTNGRRGREIVIAWIEQGCPLPERREAPGARVPNLWLKSHAKKVAAHPTGRILGMGGVH